jgi:hypothetical protein
MDAQRAVSEEFAVMRDDLLVATAIDSSLNARMSLLDHGAASGGFLLLTIVQRALGRTLMLMMMPK